MNKPFENYFSSSLYDLSSEIKKNESNIDLSDFSQIFFNKRKFSDETEKFKKVLVFYIGGSIGMINTSNGLIYKKKLLESLIRSNNYLHDPKYTLSEEFFNHLITPITAYKTRIIYRIEEFEEMLDSSDINYECYVKICERIEMNYELYDGFVILQGPPTITYSASVISFMLENLAKPVIFTGSQLPISMMRNDGFNNLMNSLIIAGNFQIPEVLILFRDNLFRGNRCIVYENNGFNCVSSPNFPHLAHLQSEIEISWDLVVKQKKKKKFTAFKNICNKIAHIKLQPLSFMNLLENILKTQDLKALIIESYGQGKIFFEEQERFITLIKEAISKEVIIVNISQCYRYNVKPSSEMADFLNKLGIINGGDMTSEATFAKLSYLIGKNFSYYDITKYLLKNLRGELTPAPKNVFSYQEETLLVKLHEALHHTSTESIHTLEKLLLPNVILHMTQKGYINFIKDLQENGIDINQCDFEGRNIFHIAARENNLNIIKHLLENLQTLDAIDKMDCLGRTPLYEALSLKNKQIVYQLKNKGAINFGEKKLIQKLLFNFVTNNDLEGIKIGFYGGMKNLEEYVDEENRNIAHLAVAEKKIEILQFLQLIARFNFNLKDEKGRTAITEAISFKNKEIIELLN